MKKLKILWFTNIMLPEFAEILGLPKLNQGGWLPSLVSALRKYAPEIQLTIACEGICNKKCVINSVVYCTLGWQRKNYFSRKINPEFISAVSTCISSINPDVIHIHGSEGVYPTLPKSVFGQYPVLISIQGILQGYYPHYMGNLLEKEIKPYTNWLMVLLSRYSIARAANAWRTKQGHAEAGAFKRFTFFAGRTSWDQAWVRMMNPSAQYFHVGEVLRPEFFRARRNNTTITRHSIYCSAAATYPLKGLHWLLRSVAFLKERYPNIQVRVANALQVKRPKRFFQKIRQSQYHRYLGALIVELGLENNIVLLPSLSAAQVAEELCTAHICCLPSLCENSPNSLGEAMLVGTPCVATYVGGIPSMVKDREEGLLCPSGDPAALAAAIECLFMDAKFSEKIACMAQQRARAQFDPMHVVGDLLSVYHHTVAERSMYD